jgi:hypothetical protein
MNLYRILYSRSYSADYRWIYSPPPLAVAFTPMLESLWTAFEKAGAPLLGKNLPVCFALVDKEAMILARYHVSERRDKNNRPIYALEGWGATRREMPLLSAMAYSFVGCHDVAFNTINPDTDLDQSSKEISSVNFVESDVQDTFASRYADQFDSPMCREFKQDAITLPYDESGFRKLLSYLEGFCHFGVRSFAFGLPRSFDKRIYDFSIVAHSDGLPSRGQETTQRPISTPPPIYNDQNGRTIVEVVLLPHPEAREKSSFQLKDLRSNKLFMYGQSPSFEAHSTYLGLGEMTVPLELALQAFDTLMEMVDRDNWILRRDRGDHWWSVRFHKD